MARSFHTTRRELEEAKRQQYAIEEQREAHLKQLDESLAKKRRAKKHSTADRVKKPSPISTLPEQVPIRTIETGPYIHYPASPKDILAVLQLLPAGVLDGIDAIELRLGAEQQAETTPLDTPLEQDPYVGRRGYELIPGVYHGQCLGSYWPEKSRIWLLAYVYDPALPDREMWEWYIRFHALSTLMHELAHHYDYANRIARGRWRGDNEERVEYYAESNGYCWTRDIVIPYLERTYACQAQQFSIWVQYHGGLAIPLSSLLVKPSPLMKGRRMYSLNDAFFSMTSIIEELAGDVAKGCSVEVTRLEFARSLHYRDDFEPALHIIDRLLVEQPDNVEILTLQADIYAHQELYDAAEKIASQVIFADKNNGDAWDVLATVYVNTHQPEKLLQAINNYIRVAVKKRRLPNHVVFHRALAKLWLGNRRGFRADVKLLEKRKRPPKFLLNQLREEEEQQLTLQKAQEPS